MARSTRNFFSRRFAPLITIWVIAAVASGLINWFERSMPAFNEVVRPLYWIIATLAVLGTWRWIRTRAGAGKDRRGVERRVTERRDDSAEPPADPVSHK